MTEIEDFLTTGGGAMLYKAEIFGKDPKNPEKIYYIEADNIVDATIKARVKLKEENPNDELRVGRVEEVKGDVVDVSLP